MTGQALAAFRRQLEALKRLLAADRSRRVLKNVALAGLAMALLLALAFFTLRNALLRSVLDDRLSAYAGRHPGAVVEVGAAKFRGLSGVDLEDIRVRAAAQTLDVSLGKCSIQVSFWKMLTGRVRLKTLALNDLHVNLRREASPAVLPARQANGGNEAKRDVGAGPAPDYGVRVSRLLDLYFTRVPDRLVIEHIFIHTAFNDIRQALYIPRLALGGPAFETMIEVFDQGRKWSCLLAGGIERGRRRLELCLEPVRARPEGPRREDLESPRRGDDAQAIMPFLERQWGLKAAFDSLAVGLQSRGCRDGVLRLEGSLAVRGLAFSHPGAAAADVRLDNAAFDFTMRVGPDFVELAEPSRVAFNRMAFQPQVRLVVRPTRQVFLKIPETRFAADDLFASLPKGLFASLAGMRAAGELAFHLDFAIDLSRPEELELDVDLKKSGFAIRRFGRVDFRAVNAPFLYTAYDKDRALRSFTIGPENPDFVPLERIPSFLKYSVLISEDGAFFSHRGFLLEPFKDSISANLRSGRFVRGGSTLSMQLTKNLYLRRHKTIARKLEEMLITWLVEENQLVSKERMLEIYLNIIEWGPGVHGAREAARFYFAKDAGDLTLAEAIFMAAVIPRPKRFMYFFGDDQRLRPWLQTYYADVASKMLSRGWIDRLDFDTLLPEVELKGPARLLLKGAQAEVEEEDLVDDTWQTALEAPDEGADG